MKRISWAKAFGYSLMLLVEILGKPASCAQFLDLGQVFGTVARVIINPVGVGVGTIAPAIGLDKEVTAATQAVVSPASLLDPNVRNSLPGEAAAIANKAAGADDAVSKAAVKIAVVPYEVQSEVGRRAIAGGSPEEVWSGAKVNCRMPVFLLRLLLWRWLILPLL